ncbi:N-alpha-acetyltransferase 80 isoform X2 [Hetaerina americana]|uniref:N-alpha-acetyltransferase 80 isoform X2 n=1 Tax=Hetaerina americana TaxID=62018 RepID=UPI003A7F3EB1
MMGDDTNEEMEVLPLHLVPHFTEQCCYLLNLEWKRSEVARLRSLEGSCDKLPTCLILIRNDTNVKEVIGHSKLTRIPSIPEGCFIESVVIHPNFRRKGLGKYLMRRTEQYAKRQGFSIAYLSTHDQQIFYGKLGYDECPPVSIYGAALPVNSNKDRETMKKLDEGCQEFSMFHTSKGIQRHVSLPPGPAPPPPPPMPVFREAPGLKKSSSPFLVT